MGCVSVTTYPTVSRESCCGGKLNLEGGVIMKELKAREELAEIRRSRRDCRGVGLLGMIIMVGVIGVVVVDHWSGFGIGVVVLGAILVVGGLLGEQYFDTKCKKYLRHMEEDTEGDK